jgi:hypothetical protein
VTHETVKAALYNLQAQINEVMGLMKDAAKQQATDDTATNIVKYSVRLFQLEGAFITLQKYAPTLVQVAKQYPIPPLPEPPPIEEEEVEPLIITEGMSRTYDRVAQVHADTAAALEEAEE